MPGPVATALMLAAGAGIRLGPRGRDTPKALLRLGGRTLLEESVERLARHGVSRLVLVTGHRADRFESLDWRPPLEVVRIHNPDYRRGGSASSVWAAGDALAGPLLLVESDLTYEDRALRVLVEDDRPDLVLLSGPTGAGDEVWVGVGPDGRLAGLSKRRDRVPGTVAGELVGLTKLSAPALRLLVEAARPSDRGDRSYEECLVAVARRRPVHTCLVPDLLWAEVDDEAQLARAVRIHASIAATGGPAAGSS